MNIILSPSRPSDYDLFLKIKALPRFKITGREAWVPDEYASLLGVKAADAKTDAKYKPIKGLFDYQEAIASLGIRKKKFSVFADCGRGKTLILTEIANYVFELLKKRGKRVLILSPLMVVKQTVDEIQDWYKGGLVFERVAAKHVSAWLRGDIGDRNAIGITNYDGLTEDLEQGIVGALLLDECFAKGTLIDCVDENGFSTKCAIENLSKGDKIINASGVDEVVSTKKRQVQYAVAVTAGERITCSPNHPLFTQRGWIGAQDLEPGDSILMAREAMRMVRGGFPSEGQSRSFEILRSILLSEMADEYSGAFGEVSYKGNRQEAWGEFGEMVGGWKPSSVGREGENSQFESDDRSFSPRESVEDSEGHGPQTFRSWGKRDWFDGAPEDFSGCVGTDLGSGICCVVGPEGSGISNKLQNRLSKLRSKSRYRGGWVYSPIEEGQGHQEGCQIGFVRVESLEVLEQGHPELERLREADGKLYFYDLEAKRHPSFSVGGKLVHNSSMLKSHYGKWGRTCLRLGAGLDWKYCFTGTPAPNDRIEFANHAVFMDAFPTINSFLAKYFVNRGQTDNRWELKPHALHAFYRDISHWCIFLSNPATYGFKDGCEPIPPINVHIHDVGLTDAQRESIQKKTGELFLGSAGGVTSRAALARIGKTGDSLKPAFIKDLIGTWPNESTLVWCKYNSEQSLLEKIMPDAASISGDTPHEKRQEIIDDFKSGRIKVLLSKPKLLGLGLNLQIATRQVFSTCQDSYEEFHQAVKRSNRIGSKFPLNVHIPVVESEVPMLETVLRKAHRVNMDTAEQERIFKDSTCFF